MATPAAARSQSTEDLSAVADASPPVIAVGDTDIRASSVCNGDVQAKSPDSPATAAQPSQPLVPLSSLILPLYLPHLLMSIGKEFVAPVLPLFARDELSSSDTVVGVALAAAGFSKVRLEFAACTANSAHWGMAGPCSCSQTSSAGLSWGDMAPRAACSWRACCSSPGHSSPPLLRMSQCWSSAAY